MKCKYYGYRDGATVKCSECNIIRQCEAESMKNMLAAEESLSDAIEAIQRRDEEVFEQKSW